MRGSIGYWGSGDTGGLCVGFGQEMLEWLDAQDTGRRVFTSVTRERRVVVLPDSEGGHVSSCGTSNGTPFRYVSCYKPDSLFMDTDIPLFELHEVSFTPELGCLSYELPRDHELPWPRLRLDCTTYEAEQLAVDALQWRLNSVFASGLTSFQCSSQRMPQRLHKLLPPGKYGECLATARALATGGRL